MVTFRYDGCIVNVLKMRSCGRDSVNTDLQDLQGSTSACIVIADPLVSLGEGARSGIVRLKGTCPKRACDNVFGQYGLVSR